jgi:hypothetical protein
MNLAFQVANLMNNAFDKIKKEGYYKNAMQCFKDQTMLHKFEFLNLINKYFGEVELKGLTIIAYTFNEHAELVTTPKTMKRCVKLIAFLIAYLSYKIT